MVDDWVARKQGKIEVKYELSAARADPVGDLRRHRLPGTGDAHRPGAGRFTMGQADVLRKAMGKKDPKVMAKQREAFIDGR